MSESVRRCGDCVMRARGILAGMPQEAFARVSCVMTPHRYPARHRLFEEGNPCTQVASVRRGLLKLSKLAENGKNQILGTVGPGFFLGYEGFQGLPSQSTAESLTEVEICSAPRDVLAAQLREHPDVAIGLVVFLSQRVQELERMALRLGTLSARQRLATHLLALHEAQLHPDGQPTAVTIQLTRQELADMLGMAKETVIRLLRALDAEELVQLRGSTIVVRDPARLRRMLLATS